MIVLHSYKYLDALMSKLDHWIEHYTKFGVYKAHNILFHEDSYSIAFKLG